MSANRRTGILGVGSYLPEKILTNQDLERMVETSDEWITTRTGIKERRVAAPDQFTSDLATEAAKKALADAGLKPTDLDVIIVSTITPDSPTPSASCRVQAKLGAPQAAAFDISAACSGFIYGIAVARSLIESGLYKKVLLIGAEKLTAFTDWKDRSTCVLFGDGAGAVVLGEAVEGKPEVLSTFLSANGKDAELLRIPGGGSQFPPTENTLQENLHTLKMAGREVYKIAVNIMTDATKEAAKRAGITLDQINLIIPHQANLRIIEAIREKMGFPEGKFFVNIDKVGNTSAASVAIALDQALRGGRIKKGDYVALVAFGAGTTLASAVLKW